MLYTISFILKNITNTWEMKKTRTEKLELQNIILNTNDHIEIFFYVVFYKESFYTISNVNNTNVLLRSSLFLVLWVKNIAACTQKWSYKINLSLTKKLSHKWLVLLQFCFVTLKPKYATSRTTLVLKVGLKIIQLSGSKMKLSSWRAKKYMI